MMPVARLAELAATPPPATAACATTITAAAASLAFLSLCRRAAPPRPTLLVGDLLDCRSAFERLQQRVLELSLAQQAMVEDSAEGSRSGKRWGSAPSCSAALGSRSQQQLEAGVLLLSGHLE